MRADSATVGLVDRPGNQTPSCLLENKTDLNKKLIVKIKHLVLGSQMVPSPEGQSERRGEAQPCGSYRLLDEVDAGLQVETEVDEVPLDALALVLLLLQDEHRVVEELLQLLVGVVDAELLEGVQLQEGDGVRQIPVAASEPPGRTGGVFGQNLLGPHRAAPCGPFPHHTHSRGCIAGACRPHQQSGGASVSR